MSKKKRSDAGSGVPLMHELHIHPVQSKITSCHLNHLVLSPSWWASTGEVPGVPQLSFQQCSLLEGIGRGRKWVWCAHSIDLSLCSWVLTTKVRCSAFKRPLAYLGEKKKTQQARWLISLIQNTLDLLFLFSCGENFLLLLNTNKSLRATSNSLPSCCHCCSK